ncbi:Trm112 family protein [Candidatus Woesearchaeota archaeon]|nr:Trm112 family protein [Candidatus Woesearchaeota archaeon]
MANKKKENQPLPKELFDILACPACKSDLNYTKDKGSLVCVKCKAKYPIKEGIPILLPKNKQ